MIRIRFGRFLMAIGALLILGAAGFVVFNQREDTESGEAAALVLTELQSMREDGAPTDVSIDTSLEEMAVMDPNRPMPTYEIDGQYYIGTIRIPAIDIELPVMSEWSYTNLNIAPCRYTGSIYTDDMILCGHNYNSHFGRLSSLSTGDGVVFIDAEGNEWNYMISQIETIAQADVDAMTSGDWDLTLFTCTLSGLQRVTVRCQRVS